MRIKEYLQKIGIEVIENKNILSAFSYFDDKRRIFVIEYNPSYSPETIEFLLLHEFLHIYREDHLKKDVIAEIYNIASDCVINEILRKTHQLPAELPPLTIESFPPCCQNTFDFYSGAKPLYEHLIEKHTEIKFHHSSCFQTTDSPFVFPEIQRIKRQVLDEIKEDIRQSTSNVPNKIKESIIKEIERKKEKNKNKNNAGSETSKFSIIPVEPSDSSILKSIINKYLKKFKDTEVSTFKAKYERLYRNSRIPNIPRDVPILSPVPITFIIDVSGSMSTYINSILNTIAHYEKEFTVQKIFFSDKAIKIEKRKYYDAGGGTIVQSALDLMKKTYMSVVFSDYAFCDMSYENFKKELLKKTKIAILFDQNLKVKEVIRK